MTKSDFLKVLENANDAEIDWLETIILHSESFPYYTDFKRKLLRALEKKGVGEKEVKE